MFDWVLNAPLVCRGTTSGGGKKSLCPFLKVEKSAMILEKCALIVFIYGLNFLFKTLLRESNKKNMVKFFCVAFLQVL